jgi:hypothetical protein
VTGEQAQATVKARVLTPMVPVEGYEQMSDMALAMGRWPFTDRAGQERFYASPVHLLRAVRAPENRDYGCLYCAR